MFVNVKNSPEYWRWLWLSLHPLAFRGQRQNNRMSESNRGLQRDKRQRPFDCGSGQESWAGVEKKLLKKYNCHFDSTLTMSQCCFLFCFFTNRLCVQLEATLAERERQLLEKQLLVEQVTRLSKPLSERVENCQEDRLSVAKKVWRLCVIEQSHIVGGQCVDRTYSSSPHLTSLFLLHLQTLSCP